MSAHKRHHGVTVLAIASLLLLGAGQVTADILAGASDPAPSGYEEWVSPLVQPPALSKGNGAGDWSTAYKKAKAFVADLTNEEKVNITTGIGVLGRCIGNTGSIPRKGFEGFCLQDSPAGVRGTDYNSVWPSGINTAATWDQDLMYQRGYEMGLEFRGKGINFALGPGMNMLRAPEAGRNWEMGGGDPYLAGRSAAKSVEGMQQAGVIAVSKHLVGNEQEHARGGSLSQAYSSNIDQKTLHEVYLWPFAETVRVGVGAIMCSYNRLNQTYACENSYLLNGLVKEQLAFDGLVMSDWAANTRDIDAALAGLDMVMPGFKAYGGGLTYNDTTGYPGNPDPATARSGWFGANLLDAVNNGTLSQARLDDMAIRIMSAYYKMGQDQNYPPVAVGSNLGVLADPLNPLATYYNGSVVNPHINVQDDHATLIRKIGAASTVLLKNTNNVLPLNIDKIRSIGLFGGDAGPANLGPNGCADRGCLDGTLGIGWGSGTANYPYLISPLEGLQARLAVEGKRKTVQAVLNDTNYDVQTPVAHQSDVCFAFVAADSGEGYITVEGNMGDRNDLLLWHNGTELIQNVAANCSNTIVVMHVVGPVDMEAFADHPNVTAILLAGLPGQESGNAIWDVVFGDYNPSARLPYTIGKLRTDYPADVEYYNLTNVDWTVDTTPELDYTEGLYLDYRWFQSKEITPRYPFGYGLSYTTFQYSSLSVKQDSSRIYRRNSGSPTSSASGTPPSSTARVTSTDNTADIVKGISKSTLARDPESLYDDYVTVSYSYKNTGKYDGAHVTQVYVSFPESAGEPPLVLRGFDKQFVKKGATATSHIHLRRKDLSVWDVPSQSWKIVPGQYTFHVGASSADIRLTGTLKL